MYKIKLLILRIIQICIKPFTKGTSFLGKIDGTLRFNVLKNVDFSKTEVIFTLGTNGKTTTNNLVAEILKDSNKVLINTEGANLISGIKTTLIKNISFSKKVNAEVLCLEIDEKTLKHVVKIVKPNHIVITNFFRDQLDRYGEIDTIIDEIVEVIGQTDAILHLNGNDPLIIDHFDKLDNRKQFYGVKKHKNVVREQTKIVELKYCPKCLTKLEYNFYHYGHIGDFCCSKCNFSTPEFTTSLSIDNSYIKINDYKINMDTTKFPTYFYFNIVAASDVACSVNEKSINSLGNILSKFEFPNGRSQHLEINNTNIYFNLAKNVVGMEETLEYAMSNFENFDLLIAFNDNYADGRDVSWIWDSDMSVVKSKVNNITITGTRRFDMAIRISSEMDNSIDVIDSITEAVDSAIKNSPKQLVIITNYTPLEIINNHLGVK